VSGACTGYFSSLIHTKRVIPFGLGFPFSFLFIKEDRRLRDRPAKFISPGQARGDGKTKQTEL